MTHTNRVKMPLCVRVEEQQRLCSSALLKLNKVPKVVVHHVYEDFVDNLGQIKRLNVHAAAQTRYYISTPCCGTCSPLGVAVSTSCSVMTHPSNSKGISCISDINTLK